MALIRKNKKITSNITTDVYVKLDSVRFGLEVNDNKILCLCREWYEQQSREEKDICYQNTSYEIPKEIWQGNIQQSDSLIGATYASLKAFFESQGETVENETTHTYTEDFKQQEIQEMMESIQAEEEKMKEKETIE